MNGSKTNVTSLVFCGSKFVSFWTRSYTAPSTVCSVTWCEPESYTHLEL